MERIKEFLRKHKKKILIALAIILIILIALFTIPFKKPEPEKQAETPIKGGLLAEQPTIVMGEITPADKEESNAKVIARTFAEIYGSYSNQSNYSNIESALPYLSAAFKAQMQNYLNTSRATYQPGEVYEGVTTIAVNTRLIAMDEQEGTASFVVETQKKESKGTQAAYTVKYQNMQVDLIKEAGGWVVDSAKWL